LDEHLPEWPSGTWPCTNAPIVSRRHCRHSLDGTPVAVPIRGVFETRDVRIVAWLGHLDVATATGP
jgi:limonene-1,2-epoxide hydrolase